ncbi:MAG TPA: response regulator, partial [Stenomitos sp.]
ESAQHQLGVLRAQILQGVISPERLVDLLQELELATKAQIQEVLRLKILNDLDLCLSLGAGTAEFIADETLTESFPLPGITGSLLLEEALQRQLIWQQIKVHVPSMNLIPSIDQKAFDAADLPKSRRDRVQSLVMSGKTLSQISVAFAQDPLEVAKIFSKLIGAGLLQLVSPSKLDPSSLMIIDDSPIVLRQFQHWVKALGYSIVTCQNAETALATILKVKPSAIFIDINMPTISGFELAKQIRQRPEIASIPLVILTGEQKLSNKWRAQWSGCEFLSKPLTAVEGVQFQGQLQSLLSRLLSGKAANAEV